MIQIESVTKLYGPVIGVNDITVTLPAGAYGLLGPNGSGKTTLLNLIIGQLKPTLGRVAIFGTPPWNHQALYRRIGICPTAEVLYDNASALEWVSYLTRLHGLKAAEAMRRAEEALAQVGLADSMRRPMGEYSKGMKQRAKLAQSLAHGPELLILDEPFNGLDPIGRFEMSQLLRKWISDGGSLLMASHILHEVEAITPAFLLIRGGRLLASGTSQEIHSLLKEFPDEIRIRTPQLNLVAKVLVEQGVVDSMQIDQSQQLLRFATRDALRVYRELPSWINGQGLEIYEMSSADDSLQTLFNGLMRMHRGEQ